MNILTDYKETHLISREFIKDRNGYKLPYLFQARAMVFSAPPTEKTNLAKLFAYLQYVMLEGVEYKKLGCSDSETIYDLDIEQVHGSMMCKYAMESDYLGKGREMHDYVQKYFAYNDNFWIANEVPVSSDKMDRSGFIDIIRYNEKEDRIMICDFKPNAAKEKHRKVCTQLTHYSLILSEQTGISRDDMDLLYFDHVNCYKVT